MQQQKQKKIPVRRCVGCNAQRPKRELVRVVRSPEGEISIDLRGKVALVLLTADASERTVKHMKEACEGIVACEQIPLTSAQLDMLTPKPAAVFGITDEHLAQLCAKHLT